MGLVNKIFRVLLILFCFYVFFLADNPEVQNTITDYKEYILAKAQEIEFTGTQVLFMIFFFPLFSLMIYDAFIDRR